MGGILGLVAGNARLMLYAAVLIAAAGMAWKVKSKFSRAAEADRIEQEHKTLQSAFAAEQGKLKKADQDRVALAADLEAAKTDAKIKAAAAAKAIRAAVQHRAECEIPVEVLKAFNAQMGHEP